MSNNLENSKITILFRKKETKLSKISGKNVFLTNIICKGVHMRNLLKSKKICKLIISIILVYTVIICISQEKKLSNYNNQKNYYESQKTALNEEKAELLEEQKNINSPEYIEAQAREKLDMYYPNERVYIAKGK